MKARLGTARTPRIETDVLTFNACINQLITICTVEVESVTILPAHSQVAALELFGDILPDFVATTLDGGAQKAPQTGDIGAEL